MKRQQVTIFLITSACVVLIGFHSLLVFFVWSPKPSDISRLAPGGSPLGADFSQFYAAASLALAGRPVDVYDPAKLKAQIVLATGASKYIYYTWFYLPTFLLILLPFAPLPYLLSLFFWLTPALSGFVAVVRRIAPHPCTVWLTLANPAVFLNILAGQNGFLSALLLGGGLVLLERSPWSAGLILGVMSYKPHLAVLALFALIAGRHWRALTGAVIAAMSLIVLSYAVLGHEVWSAFWQNSARPLDLLGTAKVPLANMASVFGAILNLGGSYSLAWLMQSTVMLFVAVTTAWVWRRGTKPALLYAQLTSGILLFSPYLYHYDLVILALPLAWLGWEACTGRGRYFTGLLLCCGWIMPLFPSPLNKHLWHLPFVPVYLLALYGYTLSEIWLEQRGRMEAAGNLPQL